MVREQTISNGQRKAHVVTQKPAASLSRKKWRFVENANFHPTDYFISCSSFLTTDFTLVSDQTNLFAKQFL